MKQVEWYHIAFLALAIILELIANIALKYSDGFKRRIPGIVSVICILLAFTALAQAVKAMNLSIAYAVWGGFGILATVATGWILFRQRLNPIGWIGLGLLLVGMSMLQQS